MSSISRFYKRGVACPRYRGATVLRERRGLASLPLRAVTRQINHWADLVGCSFGAVGLGRGVRNLIKGSSNKIDGVVDLDGGDHVVMLSLAARRPGGRVAQNSIGCSSIEVSVMLHESVAYGKH